MFRQRYADISPLVWLVLPIISYVLIYAVLFTGFPPSVVRIFGGERGLLENAQVLFLLIFLVFGGKILSTRGPLPHPRLRPWVILLVLGGLYTVLEEVSWGQHYFEWRTPAWLAALNRQNETNLHNINTDLFFHIPGMIVMYLPYNLLLTAIYAGGLVYPMVTKGRRRSYFWPTPVCVPWAVLTACASLPIIIAEWIGHPMRVRHGEMQEYFVYGFLLTYLYSLDYRLRHHQGDLEPSTGRLQ